MHFSTYTCKKKKKVRDKFRQFININNEINIAGRAIIYYN